MHHAAKPANRTIVLVLQHIGTFIALCKPNIAACLRAVCSGFDLSQKGPDASGSPDACVKELVDGIDPADSWTVRPFVCRAPGIPRCPVRTRTTTPAGRPAEQPPWQNRQFARFLTSTGRGSRSKAHCAAPRHPVWDSTGSHKTSAAPRRACAPPMPVKAQMRSSLRTAGSRCSSLERLRPRHTELPCHRLRDECMLRSAPEQRAGS
eukprot:scaffold79846_cov75-Phaeocystis_antarctica.AAC.2